MASATENAVPAWSPAKLKRPNRATAEIRGAAAVHQTMREARQNQGKAARLAQAEDNKAIDGDAERVSRRRRRTRDHLNSTKRARNPFQPMTVAARREAASTIASQAKSLPNLLRQPARHAQHYLGFLLRWMCVDIASDCEVRIRRR